MKIALLIALFVLPLVAGAQSKEQLIGCWKMPSRAGELLQLKPDGSFLFDDYNALTKSPENFYGTWKLSRDKVTLMYDDRPQQNFTLHKDKKGKWMLRKEGGFLFVKGSEADCSAIK